MCVVVGCGRQSDLQSVSGDIARPRSRVGRYAAATIGGASFADPDNLGTHGYGSGRKESNGIVYTCRGGHIDIAHVRKAVDWAAYLTARTRVTIAKGDVQFSFRPPEPARAFVALRYPENWAQLTPEERDRTGREVSVAVGQYVAFSGLIWHEMLTWFGYSAVAIYPDFPSAFAWEDIYSDLLGTRIGAAALRDKDRPFDVAVTSILNEELRRLGVESQKTAVRASREVRDRWYSGDFLFLVNMKKRNLDVGLDDGLVTPWLVPDFDPCPEAEPRALPVPTLEVVTKHGFELTFEIEPRVLQSGKILSVAYPDPERRGQRIEPAVHFPLLMEHIMRDAIKRYGPEVNVP